MRQCRSLLFSAASSPVPTDSSSSKSESQSAPNANTELTNETNMYSSSSTTSESARIVWDDAITSGLQRAKQVLEKSKAKLAARQEQKSDGEKADTNNYDDNVPFFAQLQPVEMSVASLLSSSTLTPVTSPLSASLMPTTTTAAAVASTNDARESLVKTLNAATGLITIDGEKLAARSEQEQWEFRSLAQVFSEDNSDNNSAVSVGQPARMTASSTRSEPLADRDVLASIYNLRLQLQKEDYHRIFDAKNRFIGEDN
jgi:hypothetical protein